MLCHVWNLFGGSSSKSREADCKDSQKSKWTGQRLLKLSLPYGKIPPSCSQMDKKSLDEDRLLSHSFGYDFAFN